MSGLNPYDRYQWALSFDLPHPQKGILKDLAMRANSTTWRCWPSLPTIAEDIGMSRSSRPTIRKALKALRDLGLIHYDEQRPGLGEDQKTNQYIVNFNVTPRCSQHRGAVLTTPGGGAESTTNGEVNGEVNGESYAPSSDDEANDAPSIRGIDDATTSPYRTTKAADADPISPAWYRSPERQQALKLVRLCGYHSGGSEYTEEYVEAVEALATHLEEHLNSEEFRAVYDYWSFAKTHTVPFNAATKLNQLINSIKAEDPAVDYTPVRSTA